MKLFLTMSLINSSEGGGLSRAALAAILTQSAWGRVREVDHAEMQHGVHWRMGRDVAYTRAGLELAWERLRETHPGDALALRDEIDKCFPANTPAAPALTAAPAGVRRSDAEPFWWQRD